MMTTDVLIDHVVSDAALQSDYATTTARTSLGSNSMDVVEYDDDDDANDWFLINTKNICRSCRSIKAIRIDWAQGDRICTACGVVQEERILDMNPEWRDYGDRDDRCNGMDDLMFGSYRARSGMIPNNESKYIGGLQPTTLSRSVYNGTNGVRKQGASAITSSLMAQRLRKVHRKIEHRMEQQNKVAMKNATLNLQLLRKRQRQELERREATTTNADADTENTDTVTATLNEDDDDDENDDLPDYGSNFEWTEERVCTKSDYENLLQEQERHVAQQRQALYANKWSLDRAKLLFVDSTDNYNSSHHDLNVEEIEKDPVLYGAAQDLYTCYTMICNSCTTLQLPIAIMDESAVLMSQYASRRDGLKVKGIASNIAAGILPTAVATKNSKHHAFISGKRWGRPHSNSRTVPHSKNEVKSSIELEEEKQAMRQSNKMRQMASLCAGIVFWMARYRNKPRAILAVCESIVYNHHETVSKRHCSRALQELRTCFPELARLSVNPTTQISNHTSTPSASSLVSQLRNQTSSVPKAICVQQNHDIPNSALEMSTIASMVNIIENAVQKLHLPPVAEASVRYLVLYHLLQPSESNEQQPLHHQATLAKIVPIRCAAFSFLISSVGHVMQQLAKQAQHPTHNVNQNSSKRRSTTTSYSNVETKKTKHTPCPTEDEDQLNGEMMSFDLFTDVSQLKSTLDAATTDQEMSTRVSPSSSSSILLAEDRAYEMRRMWDAWVEQLPWDRSLTQIEQSTKVTRKNVIDFYKQHVYPHRFVMLEVLCATMKDNNSLPMPHSTFLMNEVSILKKTPLSSVLLSNILVAAPLLKNDIRT